MKITVTAKMIERGVRCDSFRCPLALAFNYAGFDVMISVQYVDFYDAAGDVCGTMRLPQRAQHFQKQYDDKKTPEPFEFEMPDLKPGVEPFTHFRSVAVAHALFGSPRSPIVHQSSTSLASAS